MLLILTGTIAPSVKTLGKTKEQLQISTREKEYFEAIYYYLNESEFDKIIFCDNSNYNFQYKNILYNFAKEKGKILELLSFVGNPIYPEKYGYGAGEQEILDYIFENSKWIYTEQTWFKLTGRYIVKNINNTIHKLDGQNIYFQKQGIRARQLGVSTAFFKVSNVFYKKYLYKNILHVYKEIFNSKNFILSNFTKYPYVSLEYIYYYVLRNYLLNSYHTENYIANKYIKDKYSHYFLYSTFVRTGLLDFIWFHKMVDKIFYKKMYKEIDKIFSDLKN